MKPTSEEENLTRLIDGELSEEEAARLLREHPEWRDATEWANALGDDLRAAVSIERELPYADFFSHQIQRRIEGDVFSGERSETPETEKEAESEAIGFPLFSRLRWLSALGFVAIFGALVAFVVSQDPGNRTEIVSLYTPEAGVSATTTYHDEAGATVIHLDGLKDVPENTVFIAAPGHFSAERLARSEPVLFEFDSRALGRPVSVLSRRGSGDQMPGAILVGF